MVQAPSATVGDTFPVEKQSAAELAQHQPPLPSQSWYSDPDPAPPPAVCVPGTFSGSCRDGGGDRVRMTCPANWTHSAVRHYVEKSFRHLKVRVYHVIAGSLPSLAAGECESGWIVADIWLHRKMGAQRAAEAIDAMLCAPPVLAPGCGLPIRFLAADTQLDDECSAAASLSAEADAINSWCSAAGSTQAAGTGKGSKSAKKRRPAGGALAQAQVKESAAAEIAGAAARATIAAGEDLELLRLLPYGFAL